MKRLLAILLCLSLMITPLCSTNVFAEDNTDSAGQQTDTDSETKETDLLDGLIIPEDEGLTVADKKALINSAPLDPIVTHYAPMDKIVSEILSKIIKPNMDTYEKVLAIYDYLRDGTEYAYDFKSDAAINSMIFSAVNYKNNRDYIVLRDAYRMLTEKRGKCAHFSSAFVVLTRAIGLESYIATSTNSSTGLGGHFSSMMKLGDGLYYFDPVMGVVLEISGDMTDSCYFCYPMQNSNTNEYSYLKEQLEYFGKFETLPESVPIISNEPKGKTLGDKHFSLGTYPQTRVTDSALIEELNEQLNGVVMNQYPYSHGGGTYDSMVKSGYMSWADITYNNEKYRAVKIDDYRPKFIYTKQAKEYSMQSVTGYKPGDIYWFRFDPIEWRLTDDSNLLVADLALDSQPFNDELYLCEEGKMINGKRHYVFKDAQFTKPANDWEVSYIRGWLNDEFYNTAFTSEEKELILDTQLDPNYGDMNYFDYPGTTDKVFLLSKDEAESSEYYLAESADNRSADSTDYAQSQGACSRKTKTAGFGTTWLLRNPGTHSEDICVIDSKGSIHSAISAGCASTGIRPAIRVSSLDALIPETLATPRRLTVKATDTGQITLKSAVSNGADYYKFYCYSGDNAEADRVITTDNPRLVLNDLTPGTTYRFSVSAVRVYITHAGIEETPQTDEVSEICKTFVKPPEKLTAEPSGTGKIKITVDPVEGAVAYNIYRYVDADTSILCGTTENNELELDGFLLGTTYAFWASSLSDDGYESDLSETRARCLCGSVPPRPDNVTAAPAATDKITVSWDPVEGADSYNVFRYKNNELTLIGTTSDTSYTESGLYTDNTYTFKIQAVSTETDDYSALSFSAKCMCISIPPAPDNVTATPTKTGELTLSWSAVDEADLYRIEMYDSSIGDFKELAYTDETVYAVSDLKVGNTYSFRVYAESADGQHKSTKVKAIEKCQSIPPKPENIVASPTATGEITLSWDAVEGAATYNVYRYFNMNNTPLLGSTDKTEFTVTDINVGAVATFRIEAVSADGKDVSVMSSSVSSPCVSIPAIPENLTAKPSDIPYTIDLAWDAVEDATGYYIYKYDAEKQEFVYVAQTADTNYRFGDMSYSTTSAFKVAAVKADSARIHVSSLSASASTKANRLSEPADLVATTTKTGELTLSWSPSLGAEQYRIEVYDSALRDYTELGLTTETSYTVPDLKYGNTYSFLVTAESFNGEHKSLKSKVQAVCGSIPPKPENIVASPTATGEITLSWDAVEGAATYNVYRYFSLSNTPLLGSTDKTEFTVTDINVGAIATFRIEAVSADGKDVSAMSSSVSSPCVSIPAIPENLTAKPSDMPYTIDLAWDAVEDATGYYIYKYDAEKQEFVYVAQTADTNYRFGDMSYSTTSAFKVAAVKADSARIHVSSLSASASAKANRLSEPADLTATTTKTGELTLSWSPSLGAEQYRIEVYDSALRDYTELGLTTETSYTVPDLKYGNTYSFLVTAESFNGEYKSLKSKVQAVCGSIPPKPENIVASPTATGEITLSWDAVEGAATYNVYRYFSLSNTPLLGSTDKTEFTVTDINVGAVATFRIEAVSADGKDVSVMSSSVSSPCVSIPAIPENLTAKSSDMPYTIDLAWDAVEDATGYYIYKYDAEKQEFVYVAQTEDTNYQAEGMSNSLTSSFKIAAVKADSARIHVSSLSASASTKADRITPPVDISAVATATGEITLTWEPIPGADRYDIYHFDTDDKQYKLIGSSDNTECVIGDLKIKSTHAFRVTSVAVYGDIEYTSIQSATVSCMAKGGPDQVKNLRAEVSNGGIKLTWNPVVGATQYIIYRSNLTAQTSPEAVGSTVETVFTAGMLEPDTVYSFYVVAADETDTGVFLGTPSNSIISSISGTPTQPVTTEPTQPVTTEPTQPATTEPTQPVTTEPTQPATVAPSEVRYLLGDVDDNDDVDIVDSTYIQRYATMIRVPISLEMLMRGDVDGDKILTVVDATFIMRYCTHVKTPYPVGTYITAE